MDSEMSVITGDDSSDEARQRWHPPDNEVPAVLDPVVLAATADAAVTLAPVRVFSTGVEITVECRRRVPLGGDPTARAFIRQRVFVGVELADGRRVVERPRPPSEDYSCVSAAAGATTCARRSTTGSRRRRHPVTWWSSCTPSTWTCPRRARRWPPPTWQRHATASSSCGPGRLRPPSTTSRTRSRSRPPVAGSPRGRASGVSSSPATLDLRPKPRSHSVRSRRGSRRVRISGIVASETTAAPSRLATSGTVSRPTLVEVPRSP